MKVNEFRNVKIGDKGYKISYNFSNSELRIFEGMVHEIYIYKEPIDNKNHAIILRSEIPCSEEHKEYMDSEGFDYVIIDRKCYPLSWSCYLYSKKITECSYYAKDKKELASLKAKLKRKAVKFATADF